MTETSKPQHASPEFAHYERPLPIHPNLRAVRAVAADLPVGGGAVAPTSPEKSLRVFLCHASEDKGAVRDLRDKLKRWGYVPWLDEDQILPGQDWEREIRQAMRSAHLVLVCLSSRSEKTGYFQKELKRALDIADEQPEGAIYIVPIKLEACSVPERLSKWQFVDLVSQNGEPKLRAALELAASAIAAQEI